MEFDITIANCINSEKLHNDDIKQISNLLKKKQISLENLIVSLEAELVSSIVSQKKRGIEIIEQVLWDYLPNEDFTLMHIKLISCFALNYISDWACVDSVIGIIRCIFSSQDYNLLGEIKIDIREDENIKDEYFFNPIIKLENELNEELLNLGPGKVINEGKYFKSYTEICSYHKFINHFNIKDVENDDELYKMSIVFYLVTQVLYRVPTRQLIYSSRINIIDFFLLIFSKREYHNELIRLGPGIVPILIQHIENEKDPRVLIKAFPLIQCMIESFEEIISSYDSNNKNNTNSFKQEYDIYQIYTGRIPTVSDEEKSRLELINSSNNFEENEENGQEGTNDLFNRNGNGILSNLISEVLFSYFPLQFQSSSYQLPRTGQISPKDLKEVYFSVITCSSLIQDSLVQAIVEYIDTQGLLENIIISYDDLHFEDEKELEKYLVSNQTKNQISNKPIHLKKADQEILSESLTLLSMIKYDINPEIINKYISSIFLLINELLKNTIISTEITCNLLLSIFSIFINIELQFKNGQKIVTTAVNQFIIPKLLQKLNSGQQLDMFAFNILNIFILTNDQIIIENIKNNFLLIDILNGNLLDRIHINSKLLITLFLLDFNIENQNVQVSEINSFNFRMHNFIDNIENTRKFKEDGKLEDFELPKFCLFLILKCILNENHQSLNQFLKVLEFHWNNYYQLSEVEKNYITGISAFLLFTNTSESRKYWFDYLNESYSVNTQSEHFSKNQNSNSIIENLIYTVIKEYEIPTNVLITFINKMINSSILDIISSKMTLNKWEIINCRISNINNILDSNKWNNVHFIDSFSIKYKYWIGTVVESISSITDYMLILENKDLYYQVSKGFGILTYKLFKNIFELDDKNRNNNKYLNEIFEEIESKLDVTLNYWLIFVFVNELLIQLISNNAINIQVYKRFASIFNNWLNKKIENFDINSFNSEKIYRLVNLEVEKLVINLLLLSKSIENQTENCDLFLFKGKNKIIYNKTLRHNLFNEIGNVDDKYSEIKGLFDQISQDYCEYKKIQNDSKFEKLYCDLFSAIYITGSDLNLLKNPNSNDFSLSIGKIKYFFNKENESNINSLRDKFLFNFKKNASNEVISIITNCNSNNIGKYLFELIKFKISNFNNIENSNNFTIKSNNESKDKDYIVINKNTNDPIEELWPEVIPLTDDCYNKLNLNHKETQEKILRIHEIIIETFSGTYPLNITCKNDLHNYPVILVPIVSSMSNLNIKNIIDSFSSHSIELIILLTLIECTNFENKIPVRLENHDLVNYLTEKSKSEESNLDLEGHIKTIKKLLMRKKPLKENEIWNTSMHELQIHNLQSLSILMRILHYSRENKLMIYEKRNQNKHSLDFVFDNLCVYSILVSNILENHPNALVRFLCNLIISQIFKFPTVFRTNIKKDIIKSLTYSSNNDNNKGLRKMSCILKLKILTLNDHIY